MQDDSAPDESRPSCPGTNNVHQRSCGTALPLNVAFGTKRFLFLATNLIHEGVTKNRGTTMPAQRSWKPIGPSRHDAEIERLHLELASFNRRITELERLHPEGWKIEALKTSALVLSRQIDELRCSADDLTSLLAK